MIARVGPVGESIRTSMVEASSVLPFANVNAISSPFGPAHSVTFPKVTPLNLSQLSFVMKPTFVIPPGKSMTEIGLPSAGADSALNASASILKPPGSTIGVPLLDELEELLEDGPLELDEDELELLEEEVLLADEGLEPSELPPQALINVSEKEISKSRVGLDITLMSGSLLLKAGCDIMNHGMVAKYILLSCEQYLK